MLPASPGKAQESDCDWRYMFVCVCVCACVSSWSVKSNQTSWFGADESLDCHTQRSQYANLDLFERTLGS